MDYSHISTNTPDNQQHINFSRYTVPQIKELAKNQGIKIPSGLKKSELIQYLTGVYSENLSGIIKENKQIVNSLDVLQPKYVDTTIDWLEHLHIHGWSVTPIINWDSNFTNTFLSWFESCSPNFNGKDISTWKTSNMPIMLHGILKHYFGHTEMQWKIRELCAPIFSRIWSCNQEDLLCSYDGGCLMRSIPKETLKRSSFKQWIHNDMPRNIYTFASVQGIVNFVDNGPEDGGLVLVENSNKIFKEYMEKYPSEGIVWGPSNINDILFSGKNLIKICAPAGHIILFDSRMFHCNVHPWGPLLRDDNTPRFRMCTYVSMQPRIGATSKELSKRIRLYENGRMTGHWCYGPWFKETSQHPRTYGGDNNNKPPNIEIAQLNDLRKRLIGYN